MNNPTKKKEVKVKEEAVIYQLPERLAKGLRGSWCFAHMGMISDGFISKEEAENGARNWEKIAINHAK